MVLLVALQSKNDKRAHTYIRERASYQEAICDNMIQNFLYLK